MATHAAPSRPAVTRGQVAAAVAGNALEFYDFTVYTLFADSIGDAFFPSRDDFVRLFLSQVVFFVGFIPRPIGALVIGRIADRFGRRPAMMLSFGLMGAAIVGLASTPSYAQIGVAAPIIVTLLRLVQGFALGGEAGPATAFLVEAAPARRRGLIGAWQSASQSLSSLTGGLVGAVVVAVMGQHAAGLFGWRIAFWLGAMVLPVGLIIRRSLPETLHPDEADVGLLPDRAHLAAHAKILVLGLMVIMGFTTSTYVKLNMTSYAIKSLHMAPGDAFIGQMVNGVVGVVFTLIGGALSDQHGRKPAMIVPWALYLLVAYPAFYLLVRNHDGPTLWAFQGVMGALSSLSTGAALIWLTEGLRKEIRSLGMGGVYAIAVTVFGGATPAFLSWLVHVTGSPMSPAWFVLAAAAVCLVAMVILDETAPVRTGSLDAPVRPMSPS
jgi:MFS family permease